MLNLCLAKKQSDCVYDQKKTCFAAAKRVSLGHLIVEHDEGLDAGVLGLFAEVLHPPRRLQRVVGDLVAFQLQRFQLGQRRSLFFGWGLSGHGDQSTTKIDENRKKVDQQISSGFILSQASIDSSTDCLSNVTTTGHRKK